MQVLRLLKAELDNAYLQTILVTTLNFGYEPQPKQKWGKQQAFMLYKWASFQVYIFTFLSDRV